MRFGLLLAGVSLAALFACAKPAATTTTAAETSTIVAAAHTWTPLTVSALNVNCNAEHESVCDDKGCRAQTDGMTHAAVSYDGATGHGTFCIGESCDAVEFAPIPPGRTPDAGEDVMAAIVVTGEATEQHPASDPYSAGIVEFKRNGSSFQLIRSGVSVWTGACTPGHPGD